ncbi:hypothetical protein LQW54_005077 [Pestalotiopsis sp. IQ-011]
MSSPLPCKQNSPFLQRVWRSAVDMLAATQKSTPEDEGPRAAKRRRIAEESPDPSIFASVGPLFSDPSQGYNRTLRFQVLQVRPAWASDADANGLFHGNGSPVKKYAPDRIVQARVYLQQPFIVGAEKLYVMRDDSQIFMPADFYLIHTELLSVGDPSWPPFDDLPFSSSPFSQQSTLSSTYSYAYSKPRLSTPVMLRQAQRKDETETHLVMETDLRWSTMYNRPPVSDSGTMSTPLKKEHVNGRTENAGNENDHYTNDDNDAAGDGEEDGSEAVTPSRSLRMRAKQQNYNLKLLSDKARGRESKEAKERKKRKCAKAEDSSNVTWTLPSGRCVVLDHWQCVYCYIPFDNIEQLKTHITQHMTFHFATEFSSNNGWQIAVSQGEAARWAARKTVPKASSSVVHDLESLDLSPSRTLRNRQSAPSNRKATSSTKKLIPDNGQTMYDHLSKAPLKPGSLVDQPPIANDWLWQKHRDIIMDYTDVDSNEKEYMIEWDAFSMARKAAAGPYLSDIYLEFIEQKASWLQASQNRKHEALRHVAYLNARGLLDKSVFPKVMDMMKSAKSGAQHNPLPLEAKQPSKPANKAACGVCGQLVPATSSQLICANLDCEAPFYHDQCMEDMAKQDISNPNWHCNECC